MSAAAAAHAVAVLRRAALLAGLLAVIAGFLGMHILTGSHGHHTQGSSPGSIQSSTAPPAAGAASAGDSAGHPAGHSSHGAAGTAVQGYDSPAAAKAAPLVKPAAATIGGTQVPPSCVCQGGCAEKPSAHTDCVPSPSGASLSAPQPGNTPLEHRPWTDVRADRSADYAHLPGTPTPLDLSISRT